MLELREPLDTGRIEDMQHRLVAYLIYNLTRIGLEHADLPQCEIIRIRILGSGQMREYRLHPDKFAVPQERCQFRDFACHETQTMHARIQLYVHRIIRDSSLLQCLAEQPQ